MPAPHSPLSGSPLHGFHDDDEDRLLLRSDPPEQSLRWAAAELGGRVVSVRPLAGGTSSAVHLVTVDRGGRPLQAVLRRYVRPQLNLEEPDIADREARALAYLADLDLPTPTPRLLAADPTGEHDGLPAVLMSYLPGSVDWDPSDLESWLARTAAILPPLHASAVPPDGLVQAYAGYAQDSYEPPGWTASPQMWERAVEIFHGPPPADCPDVFLHRDFHPGNVLWSDGQVTGLVDWACASVGPRCVDVGHCRANLLGRFGVAVADRFTAIWESLTGHPYHVWADVSAIVGFLDDLRERRPTKWRSLERAVARAVADSSAA